MCLLTCPHKFYTKRIKIRLSSDLMPAVIFVIFLFGEHEILAMFSEEPDDEHQWTEQDIYEQSRKIIRKYE